MPLTSSISNREVAVEVFYSIGCGALSQIRPGLAAKWLERAVEQMQLLSTHQRESSYPENLDLHIRHALGWYSNLLTPDHELNCYSESLSANRYISFKRKAQRADESAQKGQSYTFSSDHCWSFQDYGHLLAILFLELEVTRKVFKSKIHASFKGELLCMSWWLLELTDVWPSSENNHRVHRVHRGKTQIVRSTKNTWKSIPSDHVNAGSFLVSKSRSAQGEFSTIFLDYRLSWHSASIGLALQAYQSLLPRLPSESRGWFEQSFIRFTVEVKLIASNLQLPSHVCIDVMQETIDAIKEQQIAPLGREAAHASLIVRHFPWRLATLANLTTAHLGTNRWCGEE